MILLNIRSKIFCLLLLIPRAANICKQFYLITDGTIFYIIKSGAATNPGCRNISWELLDRHTGWRRATFKQRYIKYSSNDLLQVSKALGV